MRILDNEDPVRHQASAERALRAVSREAARLLTADPLDGVRNIASSPTQSDTSLTCEAPESKSSTKDTREDDAAEALILLGAHPAEFYDVDSAAVVSLL